MPPDQWKRLVVEEARKISDRAYQEQTWFGRGERVSSPEELYCGLFDDYLFDAFLKDEGIALTQRQRATGGALKQALENYSSRLDQLADPLRIIDDPQWEDVRRAAAAFVRALESAT